MSLIHPRIERQLRDSGISYSTRAHADFAGPIRSPADFAAALGYEQARVTKTLFLKELSTGSFLLVTLPFTNKLNFETVAALVGGKRVQMGSPEELQRELDYPRNGVSPLGAGKCKVFIQNSLLSFSTILVGGGAVGIEIEIGPSDLLIATEGVMAEVALRV